MHDSSDYSVTLHPVDGAAQPAWLVGIYGTGGVPARWGDWLAALSASPAAGAALSAALVALPVDAIFLEFCPITAATRGSWVAAVARVAPGLGARPPSPAAFAARLAGGSAPEVRTFPNTSGDAQLVVPCPPAAGGSAAAYGHLLSFLRGAPAAQVGALWAAAATALRARLSARPGPAWLSTSGLGVPWLHIRVDDRPKYIGWEPFRRLPPAG
jgi:hypothetical protein